MFCIHRTGHQVNLGFQAHSGHPQRLLHPLLVVDDELLGKNVEDLLVGRDGHGLGRIDDPVHVLLKHLPVAHRHDPVRVDATNVAACYARVHRIDLASRHELCLFHGALYGLHGGLDIHHSPFLQTPGGVRTQTNHLQQTIRRNLRHDSGHLVGTDIQSYDPRCISR